MGETKRKIRETRRKTGETRRKIGGAGGESGSLGAPCKRLPRHVALEACCLKRIALDPLLAAVRSFGMPTLKATVVFVARSPVVSIAVGAR